MTPDPTLTERIIGLGIKVHRVLGPGLLETYYIKCLCKEFHKAGIAYRREVPLPLIYDGELLGNAYRADIIAEDTVLLEIKATEQHSPLHEAQTRTYLRLSGCKLALLMNFNTPMLKYGLKRFIN